MQFSIGTLAIIWLVIIPLMALLIQRLIKNNTLSREKTSVDDNSLDTNATKSHFLPAQQSINIIAQSMIDGQMDIVEGAIRLKHLLDALPLSETTRYKFAIFSHVNEKVQHIPTHSAWQQLSRQERFRFEKLLDETSIRYGKHLIDSARELLRHPFHLESLNMKPA